jgi:hypothetical protein
MSIPVHSARVAARTIRLFTAVFAMCTALPAMAAADPVMEWNDIARQLVIVPALAPVQQTRAMAIVHLAMHDAVNGITGDYERYIQGTVPPAGSSPDAAAIAAAFHTLTAIFGPSVALEAKYAASLAAHGVAPTDAGIAVGQSAAAAILAARQHDGAAQASYPYLPPDVGAAGVWAPISTAAAAQALLPGWGSVAPFVLRTAAQFRPDAPPALDSEQYARDYEEVVGLGAALNSTRSNEETQIALFWRASPTALWNPVLRQAVASRQLTLSDTARVTALFYLAAADASIACWEAKYFYNFWRPQPAIARGDTDGNAATAGDPAWRPLVPTAPHPEYPSGHTSNSGAMAAVLGLVFGDSPGFVIEAASPQNVGFIRYWQTFGEGVQEVIDARVYSGIHFRTSDEVGARLGRQVARFVTTHALRRAKR